VDTQEFELDLEEFVDRFYGKPLGELRVGRLLLDLLGIVSRYQIRLPPDIFLLMKVLITLEGVGRKLDDSFNMIGQAKPFVEVLEREKYRPSAVARSVRAYFRTFVRFMQELPGELIAVFDKMRKGTLKIEFEHKGLEQLTAELDRSSNRISFSLIIAALVVGSSIIMHANRGPFYLGFPLLGLVGFVVAGIMGIWLVTVIIRSGQF